MGDERMGVSRRTILRGASALPFLTGNFALPALAQAAPAASTTGDIPPMLFVHGNGDQAALWITTLWRMESNGVPREKMFAINFTDPLARNDDAVAQPGRSSTEDQRRALAEAIAALKRRTGAARVALVGNSRGGNSIRSFIKNGGSGDVSHAVLCGVPNHGVYAWDDNPGSEFNGRGPFLRSLNEGESEVTPGIAFLTLRSDGLDKFAQPDGRFVGKPGVATNITAEGPALKGATNLMLGPVDHRETAYSSRAFREIFKFIAGREPERLEIVPEKHVKLSGLVTGTPGGVQTNRPVAGATVEVFRVASDTGERIGAVIHTSQTGESGRWGPAEVDPSWPLEIVLTSSDQPITHFYRSPFPPPPTSCICAPRGRSVRPTPAQAPWCCCRGRAAISGCRATWCCSTARSRPTSNRACRQIRSRHCGCRLLTLVATSQACSTKSGSWRGPGLLPKAGLRSRN